VVTYNRIFKAKQKSEQMHLLKEGIKESKGSFPAQPRNTPSLRFPPLSKVSLEPQEGQTCSTFPPTSLQPSPSDLSGALGGSLWV
jgi:hypothetical protein